MEQFDPVVQMQLAEFQRHILGATASELVVIITEKGGVAQAATGSDSMSENDGKASAAALTVQVASALLENGTGGQYELLVRDKKSGTLYPAGKNMDAVVVKV